MTIKEVIVVLSRTFHNKKISYVECTVDGYGQAYQIYIDEKPTSMIITQVLLEQIENDTELLSIFKYQLTQEL